MVKRRVRATPDAKVLRVVRVDMLSPANPSELNFSVRLVKAAFVFLVLFRQSYFAKPRM